MRRILALLAIFSALALSGCGGSVDLITDDGIDRSSILLAHNKERGKEDIEQLEHSDELQKRAQEWAEWMASHNSLTHSSLRGMSFRSGGENIAMGYDSIEDVVHGWMTSRGHRRNIMNPNFTHAGFGYARRKGGRAYWCAQFGEN